MSEQHETDTNPSDSTETSETPSTINQPIVNGLDGVKSAVESRARRMGWVPKEEFKGDGGIQWIDAQAFVDRAEASAGILIERNRALDARLDKAERLATAHNETITGLKQQLADMTAVMSDFRDFASKAQERAYKRARADVEKEMGQAVAEADVPKFNKAKAELDELNQEAINEAESRAKKVESKPPVTPPESPKSPVTPSSESTTPATQPAPIRPEVLAFINANDWFNTDATLNRYMQDMHMSLLREKPGLNLVQNLEEAKKLVIDKFPERFGINPRRNDPPTVGNGATTRDTKPKKKTYDDLPPPAKEACDKFVRTIPPKLNKATGKMEPYSRQEYVDTYFLGDEEE